MSALETSATSPAPGRRHRVLVGKPGLDGHDRGAKVVARALRDAGMEVVYTGLHQTAAMIAAAAVQEDVDLVGISVLSGAHNHLVPEVIRELERRGAGDIPVFVGGIIPQDDVEGLKQQGVIEVFGPGARLEDIVASIRRILEDRDLAQRAAEMGGR